MSVAAPTAPSPGWYPDPEDADHLRWWDGDVWTEHVTDLPGSAWQSAFAAEVLDEVGEDEDPIEFSWEDEADDFVFGFLGPEFEPEIGSSPGIEPAWPEPTHRPDPPVYEPPAPTSHRVPAHDTPEPDPIAAQPAPAVAEPARSLASRRAVKGGVGLVVCAALAAQVTNLLSGEDAPAKAPPPAVAGVSAADKTCLKEWNTAASGTAAELRVTLGQFTGAYARVGRVAPLPGTLMVPDSCALTVYDPSTDTNVVFVSGVPDQVGYMDVTSYPRAKAYGWPKSANQANVAVREDGTIAAIS